MAEALPLLLPHGDSGWPAVPGDDDGPTLGYFLDYRRQRRLACRSWISRVVPFTFVNRLQLSDERVSTSRLTKPVQTSTFLASVPACALKKLRQRRIFWPVRYVFDPAKDAINRAKHGVPLALAEILFAGPHVTTADDRFDYGEIRQIAFGQIGGRTFVCVYVDRQAERRVISLRKANKREVKRHAEIDQ